MKKIVFCSGKTYYDLFNERKNHQLDSQIAIVRIEQLCPFPFDLIKAELEKYKNAKICFAQEEHKNMGPVSDCLDARRACERSLLVHVLQTTSRLSPSLDERRTLRRDQVNLSSFSSLLFDSRVISSIFLVPGKLFIVPRVLIVVNCMRFR